MNTEKTINTIYEKMHTAPLSLILPMMLPLALECKDYEGYCILTLWGKPISKNKEANKFLKGEIYNVLYIEGLTEDIIHKIVNNSYEKYISMRSVDKDMCLIHCAKEMEDIIKTINDTIDIDHVPQGATKIEAFYLDNDIISQKFSAINIRTKIEQQYALLQSYMSTKMTQYKRICSIKERTSVMENKTVNSKNIFIIHGHNEAKRRELTSILKERFNLNPIILSEQPDQGLTIIEKFEKFATNCSYAFALFTPDDIVTNGDKQYFQARPNVIFELGWFYSKLGRSRVCILDQASEQSKIFSDLQGVMRMQFNENISEKFVEIERELKSVGIIN